MSAQLIEKDFSRQILQGHGKAHVNVLSAGNRLQKLRSKCSVKQAQVLQVLQHMPQVEGALYAVDMSQVGNE